MDYNSVAMDRLDQIIVIIPARYHSTRFEGKPLALIDGQPMIWHVYNRARQAGNVSDVIVATDDERIYSAITQRGGKAQMTLAHHKSGTDRIAEAAQTMDTDIIINVQGDEPLIDPLAIEQVGQILIDDPSVSMATLMTRINPTDYNDPNIVKVITDQANMAIYFSRAPIPYLRQDGIGHCHKHVGIYAYRKDFLLTFANLTPTPLETTEGLEQLRAIEYGYKIKVAETPYQSISVDVPTDIEKILKYLSTQVMIKPE